MAKNLTDRFLQAVKPPRTGRREIVDRKVRGLVLRITDRGAISWAMRYRPKGMVQRRATIGAYPAVKVADARQRAKEIAAAAGRGIDLPAEERAGAEKQRIAAAGAISVADLLHRYVTEYCEPNQRRPEIVRRMFESHVIPAIGDKPLAELRRAELVELLDDLQNEKAMRAQVNRVRSQLVAAFNWAIERELMEHNPAATIKKRKIESPRVRTLSHGELRAVWKAAAALPAPSGPLVQSWILTATRRDEMRCARWSEIDLDNALMTLPAARNKGKRDFELPLSPAMVELLKGLPRHEQGEFVFSMNGKRPYAGTRRLKETLYRRSGVSGWIFHDFRRTVRSGLAEIGIAEEVAERVLNHAQKGLVKTYNVHQYREEKRAALVAWADRIAFLVSKGRDAPNVVELETVRR